MKKVLAIAMVVLLLGGLAGCVGDDTSGTAGGGTAGTDTEGGTTGGGGGATGAAELILVTDAGTIDDKSFNQGTWEGLKRYADANGKTYTNFQPTANTTVAFKDAVDLAVRSGAKVVLCSGFLFEPVVYAAQDQYPDVKFILVDGIPNDDVQPNPNFHTADNTVSIKFAEQEAGFLAGYAIVKEGKTQLGFMGGMAVPPVVRFGYGFLQGADYAAEEMGLAKDAVSVKYNYTGGFVATPEAQTMASSWFNAGTQVIFACGGAVGNSVMAAAAASGGQVIGVDVDQSTESPTVITSAMKELSNAVYDNVKAFYEDSFPGGENLIYSAANDGVGLPMDTSRFENFTKADYDAIFNRLKAGEIPIMSDADAEGRELNISDLGLKLIHVTEIN